MPLSRVTCPLIGILFPVVVVYPLFTQTAQPVRDSVTSSVTAGCSPVPPAKVVFQKELGWKTIQEQYKLSTLAPQCASNDHPDPNQVYIFHVAHWRNDSGTYSLVSSEWYSYIAKSKAGALEQSKQSASGDPEIYAKKGALIVAINVFDSGKSGGMSITYKIGVKQGTAENVQDLKALLSSLLGLTLPAAKAQCEVMVAAKCQDGTAHLPFDINIAATASMQQRPANQPNDSVDRQPDSDRSPIVNGDQSPTEPSDKVAPLDAKKDDNPPAPADKADKSAAQNAQPGTVDCSDLAKQKTCTFNRTFTSLDREWWDISIGVAIPGPKETKYAISSGSVKGSVTTHTDLYGLFDVYPFAYWHSKQFWAPHFAVGLPVTSQVFYRPFFGLSENLTGWSGLERRGFPFRLNLLAGVVYMKTQRVQGSPTTADALASATKYVRVTKPLIGVEVPINSIIDKLGGKKSANNNGASSGKANAK